MTIQCGFCKETLTYAQAFRGYFRMNGLLGWLVWVLVKWNESGGLNSGLCLHGRTQSKEMLEGLRQELGLKGWSSLAQHCQRRCGDECPDCKDLRVILVHYKLRPVGHHGAGRGGCRRKDWMCWMVGWTSQRHSTCPPRGFHLLLGTSSQILWEWHPLLPSGTGSSLARRTAQSSLIQGQRQKLAEGDYGTCSIVW